MLHDVDLVLPEGEKLALVGPTGAGKSTLAKLMARLYDPTEGRVTFAGTDLRDAQVRSLRTRITVVPQEGYLFAGTIVDNIRIGRPDATDAEVRDAALESLGLLDRFEALPEGLDTEVHERGSRLSAGERQLVSLARAALADPAVLVLDEATSSLDPGTEVLVERALERLVRGPHRGRDRPPAVHRGALGSSRRGGRRPAGRAGHPRRAGGPGRPLRRAVQDVGGRPRLGLSAPRGPGLRFSPWSASATGSTARSVAGTSGRTGVVWNPATGQQSAEVDLASVDEVAAAVAVAKEAQRGWRATGLSRRAEVMFRLRDLIDANKKDLADVISAEHGKVPSDALGEIARGLENVEYACGVPNLLKGGYSEQAATGVDVYSIRQPLGVVAGITPFNFPAMVPLWMLANALACGNTFILKPSEKDPSAALFLADLLAQAGLPPGVFNVVNGDKVAVDAILHHPDIAAVSFVGSTPIARYIYETGTAAGKRVQALGGAKNHMLVLPDADLDMAADAAVSAAYGSAGERCMAISVVLAMDAIADELIAKLTDRIPAIKVGPGTDPANEMGPLITAEHRDKVAGYVTGAGGGRHRGGRRHRGRPTTASS